MALRRIIGRRLHAGLTRFLGAGASDPADRYRLTLRLNSLLDRLRDRLDPRDYTWALENSNQTEWELALAAIHDAVGRGSLSLEPEEARDLKAIAAQVDQRLVRQLLSDNR